MESVKPDMVTGGTEDEVIGVAATDELSDEVVNVQDESGYGSRFADTASVGKIEQGGESDQEEDMQQTEGGRGHQVADMLDTEGGGLSEDVQNDHASVEVEEEQPGGQSPRPVRVRKPPDRYGEWILNRLQRISDRLKMLEDKQREDKERIQKLRPKLLKKARTLQGL